MNYKISDSEYEIMEIIWKSDDFISISDVHKEIASKQSWAYKTVATFIKRLCDKGILVSEKQGKANVYKACISEEDYIKGQTNDFLEQIHNGSKRSLIATLFDGSVSDERIEQLLDELEG